MPSIIHIAIVEDQEVFREFARKHLSDQPENFELHFFNSAETFLSEVEHEDYQLLYIDLKMRDMNGIDLIQNLSLSRPDWKCVVFSSLMSDEQIFESLKYGAIGYLFKSEIQNLADITRVFLSGGSIISPSIAVRILKNFQSSPHSELSTLSKREKQVLDELVKGRNAEQISDTFSVSVHTVRTQIRSIYRKLQVSTRVELVRKIKA